jgi:hypothetical protein
MGDTEWCLTSGEKPRTHLGRVFSPAAIERTEIDLNQEADSGSIEVTVPTESEIGQEFLIGLPPVPVWLNIYEGHDGDAEILNTFAGKVAKANFKSECVLYVTGDGLALRKRIPGPVYQQSCNRRLYSPSCGANEAANSFVVPVAAIAADGVTLTITDAAFLAYWNANWPNVGDLGNIPSLAAGRLKTASGRWMMIETHPAAGTVKLKAPVYGLAAGDTVTLYRGCRRNLQHCAFYGRTHRFLATDIMPTRNPASEGLA